MPRSPSPYARSPLAWWVRVLSVLVLVATGSLPAWSASPPPARERLLQSLLAAEDLPGFTGRALDDPSDLDIDRVAFDAQRGMEHMARAWVSQELGVVFDHRMLFPTSQAAREYLTAAEPTLSEADDAGLRLVADDPLTSATRHWAGETRIGAEPVATDVWLIPVGPVVAKVAATVFGPALTDRRAIAQRALARLEAAYGPADAPSPSGSPGTAATSPASDIELVQALVQAVLRTGARGCEDPGLSLPGEVVAMSCTTGDVVVVYRQFTDAAARDAAYAMLLDEVPEPDGTATSCADGAWRGSVTEDDRAWAMACWESASGLVLLWTEPSQAVLGAILAPPFADLMGLWRAARFVDDAP